MRSFIYAAVFTAALFTVSAAKAETRTCEPVTKAEIAALFDRWNASLQTGKPEEVVKNYAADAVLLPTVSNKPRTDREDIVDYFEHFLQKKPKGVINTRTIHIGCNEAFDVGTYTFTVTGPDGKTSEVPARYTYIYELRGGKWLITHHHSSAMPEKADAPKH